MLLLESIYVLGYSFLRAFNVPIYKLLTLKLHPFLIDLYGNILFFFILFPLFYRKTLNILRKFKRGEVRDLLVGYFLAGVGAAVLDLSIALLEVKSFSLFMSLLPVVVAVYSVLFTHEKPGKFLWIATIIATIGSIIFRVSGIPQLRFGDIAVILGVLLFGLSPIYSRRYIPRLGVLCSGLVSCITFTPIILVLSFIFTKITLPPMDLQFFLLFVFNMLVVYQGSSILLGELFKRLPAAYVTTITTALVPVGSIIIGMFLFHETISLQEILGGALMIGAALLAKKE